MENVDEEKLSENKMIKKSSFLLSFFSALFIGLIALSAFGMVFVILYLNAGSSVIQDLAAKGFFLRILTKVSQFFTLILGICLFLMPLLIYIGDNEKKLIKESKAKLIVKVSSLVFLPYLSSVITLFTEGYGSAWDFFGKTAVTWYVSSAFAFTLVLCFHMINSFKNQKKDSDKSDKSENKEKGFFRNTYIVFVSLVFLGLFFLTVVFAYQNIKVYGWIQSGINYYVWLFSLLVNIVYSTRTYFFYLKDKKL